MATATGRLYILTELDRCPRCLAETAIEPRALDSEGVRHGVCPSCEAIVGVFDVQITYQEDQG